MKIEINNRQKARRPHIAGIRQLVRKLMDRARPLSPDLRWGEISVVLMDDVQMKECKAQLFDVREVTDVISLRYDPIPGEKNFCSGEIFVNVQRAAACSGIKGRDWNASRELALYLAHACDHLMNSKDYDRAGYLRMRRREMKWLRDRDIAALSTRLI